MCRRGLYWVAILVATLAYGAVHIPQTGQFVELTPLVVAYVLLINAAGGIAFGWVYWRHPLVAAVFAHVIAGVITKVVEPAIMH